MEKMRHFMGSMFKRLNFYCPTLVFKLKITDKVGRKAT